MAETSYITWNPASQPPKLGTWEYASVKVLAETEDVAGKVTVRVLKYQRTIVRKKIVERWEDEWDRIYYGKVLRWAYFPKPSQTGGE